MQEGTEIPQIKEIKRKKGVELIIQSCYPAGTKLTEQLAKVDEEMQEVATATCDVEIAKELLDLATAAIGAADIAMSRAPRVRTPIQLFLQQHIDNQYHRKQKEWEAEE